MQLNPIHLRAALNACINLTNLDRANRIAITIFPDQEFILVIYLGFLTTRYNLAFLA